MDLQRRGPPPGRARNTTATLAEPLHPDRRPAGLAIYLWLVGRRQEGGCGGLFFPYNGVRPHLPGSCQGWGDGWSVLLSPAMPAVAEQLAPNNAALEESIPAFLPAVKQAQPGRTFWPVARQTPNPCRLETGGTRHSANNEVLQQSAATISTIRRIHAPRGACGQETRSAGWVNILA